MDHPKDGNGFKEFIVHHWKFALVVASVVVWVLNTFAEKTMVKELHQAAISHTESRHKQSLEHADKNYNANRELLIDIRGTVNRMEDRQWEFNKTGQGRK